MKSAADLLHEVSVQLCPKAAERYAYDGSWDSQAPYQILQFPNGLRRVTVMSEEGDSYSGNGKTVPEAVANLHAKVFKEGKVDGQ